MVILMLIISIIMAVLYIIIELTQKPLIALFFKGLASLSFILLGLSHILFPIDTTFPYPSYLGWMVIGLGAGMLGDLVLALRPLRDKEEDKTIILFGILSFSIGHLFYLYGITRIAPLSWISWLIGLGAMIIVIAASYLLKFKMGIARIPSYLYSFLIFIFVGQSLIMSFQNINQSGLLMLASGAILFGISDLILAPIYYQNNQIKWMIALNLITYYGAQILIALSLYFI